jgi:type III restriction enzyme
LNPKVNAIAGRLSLRAPQRRSLEILDRITEIVPPQKGADLAAALGVIRAEYPTVTDFEREFPSFCFALATGVGKTRLMGAFISYLHLAHGINNFFVMAPNLTIYNKLITDFTPNTSKYVFKGIAEFAADAPEIITGDNYEAKAGTLFDQVLRCKVNIFNISKINSEVRGGKLPRIKRLSEYIGESYFEYLAGLPDLVLIMDESHRYRASAGVRAINELKPLIGLELTATPFIESAKEAVPFKNVILDYPLGKAMADGFVKEPAVITRKNFNPAGMTADAIEIMKLQDGVRLHEQVKVELETYARESGNVIVKPFVLVIARDTTHAKQLIDLIQSDAFFEGRYKTKVIQVDSSKTGAEEDEMVERLLKVEHTDEPTEIVIHVNMLKEGWDVTNLYTIIPLRAANARILIEQSIGRGLRLPYGKRTGVNSVDRLNIIAHDKFQEIVDEAKRPDSAIRLQQVVLEPEHLGEKTVTVVSQPRLDNMLGVKPNMTASTSVAGGDEPRAFKNAEEEKVALIARGVIRKLENQPQLLPSVSSLENSEVQALVVQEVAAQYRTSQQELEGITTKPDIQAIVARTTELVIQQTIDIPRILVVPTGTVQSGFNAFKLKVDTLNYPPVSEELWAKHLRTDQVDIISTGAGGFEELRIEDYVVRGLIDFDDVSYDAHADLLYDLAGQVIKHLKSYLKDEHEVRKVLGAYQRDIAKYVHVQMQEHFWEKATGYEIKISKGFSDLKESAYTASASGKVLDYREPPADKSNMAKYLFGGFKSCLYAVQKFQSDAERRLSVLLEREATKWFKPAKGQFQIFYKSGGDHAEYQPDFVAEVADAVLMLEPKAQNEIEDPVVVAKKNAALEWCKNASNYAKSIGGKPWKYVLIPHSNIQENMTLAHLVKQYEAKG